jgi:microcystin-dependent protein
LIASVIITEDDIEDLRGFFHRVQQSAVALAYAPSTAGDWDSLPTQTKSALDELASRLTTPAVPLDVAATTASLGTDRDAARADHRHAHADLSGVVTTHHDAVQVEVNLSVPADWLVAHANLAPTLDEIGARLNTAVTPSQVHVTTSAVGANLESAHADHVHAHGDLSGTSTTHHDALQIEYNPATPGDWSPSPTNATTALDQLALRVTLVEGTFAPVGTVVPYAGPTAPTGWLICDGSVQDAIAGEGSSGTAGPPTGAPLSARTITDWGGEENHQLTVAELASHRHTMAEVQKGESGTNVARGAGTAQATSFEGGDVPHNTMHPFLALNYIIKK